MGLSLVSHASDIANAMQAGDFSRVQQMISEGADVNEPQVDGAIALHWASQWNDVESARQLINVGSDVNKSNRTGATPLQLAAINGSPEMLSVLLEAGQTPMVWFLSLMTRHSCWLPRPGLLMPWKS